MCKCENLVNLYKSQDLTGDVFCSPLRTYHGFVVAKFSANSCLAKVVWAIVNILTSIVLYPLLGILAGFGVLIKLTGINAIASHNEQKKNAYATLQTLMITGLKAAAGFSHSSTESSSDIASYTTVKDVTITKAQSLAGFNETAAVNTVINQMTTQYKKVFIQSMVDTSQVAHILIQTRA